MSLLRNEADSPAMERLHAAIEAEIRESDRTLSEAEDPYDEFVIDEECSQIEELLGLAFVAAQSFLTRIRTRTDMLNAACKRDLGSGFNFIRSPKAYDVFVLGDPLNTTAQISKVQVINAVANYWKHSDEWTKGDLKKGRRIGAAWDTTQMRPVDKRTVALVSAIGLEPGSTGTLEEPRKLLAFRGTTNCAPSGSRFTSGRSCSIEWPIQKSKCCPNRNRAHLTASAIHDTSRSSQSGGPATIRRQKRSFRR